MLLTMKSQIEAMRSLALYGAHQLDLGHGHADEARRAAARACGDLLIPVIKGCSTESGIDICSLGIQVHGGMGFIEDTGAAQPYRDVRITAIYEGTTAIQANDFVGRKLARDRGAALAVMLDEVKRDLASSEASITRDAALESVTALEVAARSVLQSWSQAPERALAVAVPLLRLTGLVLGGWLLAKSAAIATRQLAAGSTDTDFLRGKIATAHFYATHALPGAAGLARVVVEGAASVIDTDAALV
jgi:hypothetical protein